jgi:methionyl-tRNA formyltransferase
MRIALLGCKGTTLDLLNYINFTSTYKISQLITLPEEIAVKNKVAFYDGDSLTRFCHDQNIPVYRATSYNLQSSEDLDFFKSAAVDLLIVIGWERLLPDAILQSLKMFACGMHGSPYGLPKGRGRSPLNWSIITGQKQFITYLFRYNTEIDAGDIIDYKSFEINDFDTIATLHTKNRIVMNQLLGKNIPLIANNSVKFTAQPSGRPTYYPKRTRSDGLIDWRLDTLQIYNQIRAVTTPYPSAFTIYKEKEIVIHAGYPFDATLFKTDIMPGTILDISVALNRFVVKTADSSLVITEFSGGIELKELEMGAVLTSGDYQATLSEIRSRYQVNLSENEKEI